MIKTINKKLFFQQLLFGILTIFVISFLLSPQISLATSGIDTVKGGLKQTADKAGFSEKEQQRDLPTLMGQMINYGFGILGVIFLTIVLIGGYLWMTAGGSEEKIEKAKKFIINGVNGMIVIFLAYALAYVILFSLGNATG